MQSLGMESVSMADWARINELAERADVTLDALGGATGSTILAGMRAGSTFVGYGLLTARPLSPPETPRATYQRFHLREHLQSLSSARFTALFDRIWPLLMGMQLPEVRVWPARAWKTALREAEVPGQPKQMLDLSSVCG